MDQYYPAWRARSDEKFADVRRRITGDEFDRAVEYARAAGLWRLDTRWRDVRPRTRLVEIPSRSAEVLA